MAAQRPLRTYRVRQYDRTPGAQARESVVEAVGPLQAALATATEWSDGSSQPVALIVERSLEASFVVAIEWTTDDGAASSRYLVTPAT